MNSHIFKKLFFQITYVGKISFILRFLFLFFPFFSHNFFTCFFICECNLSNLLILILFLLFLLYWLYDEKKKKKKYFINILSLYILYFLLVILLISYYRFKIHKINKIRTNPLISQEYFLLLSFLLLHI